MQVEETDIYLNELLEADEVFCTGTAVVIAPVGKVTHQDKVHHFSNGNIGPITKKCKETLTYSTDPGNLVGDIIIGGLIGAAIGNAVSDAHGMGALGTSLGALFVADSYDQNSPTYKCTRKTIYREQQEKVLNHYDVKVRLYDKFITFKSNRPFKRHSFVKVRSTERYTLIDQN